MNESESYTACKVHTKLIVKIGSSVKTEAEVHQSNSATQVNPTALRKVKTLWSFRRSECNRVKTAVTSGIRFLFHFFSQAI